MKRILLLALMTTITLSASAQFWYGASFSAGMTKVEESDPQLSLGIAPQIGYSFTEHFGVGVEVSASTQNAGKEDLHTIGFAPFIRYTFCDMDKAHLFVDAGIIYASTKHSELSKRMTTRGCAITPGIIYPIGERWKLLTTFGSIGWSNSEYEGQHIETWQCDLFQSVSVGFVFRM